MRFWRDVGEAMTYQMQRQKFRDTLERAIRSGCHDPASVMTAFIRAIR